MPANKFQVGIYLFKDHPWVILVGPLLLELNGYNLGKQIV